MRVAVLDRIQRRRIRPGAVVVSLVNVHVAIVLTPVSVVIVVGAVTAVVAANCDSVRVRN